MLNATQDSKGVVDQLNSFLRGEISAAETYRQALEKIQDPNIRAVLIEARESHLGRMLMLQEKILACGGKPAEESGAWGTFAKLVEGAALPFGDSAAVAALEEGEDHGLRDYRADLTNLDVMTQSWFQSEILKRQQDSHAQMSQLKRTMALRAKA